MITIVGMGNSEEDITLKGIKAINQADIIIVKTSISNTYKYFSDNNLDVITLDYIYEKSQDFNETNNLIVDKVLSYQDKDTVYCVEGSAVDDSTVTLLKKRAEIQIIPGISYDSKILSFYPNTNYQSIFATDFVLERAFYPDTKLALIIKEIDNTFLAGDVKIKLLNLVGNVKAYYLFDNEIAQINISSLDRQSEYDNSSMLLIPSINSIKKERYNFSDLMEITYRLRDPNGCKWDKAQTHQSIRANAIEEAYELVEAIELNDIDKILEESGDVLLQGVFHAVIAESKEEFNISDLLSVLCDKLITRHTHIFGNTKADNKEEALLAWENAKAKEKGHMNYSDKLESIANNLPALIKAYKIQKTAKKSGFDWPNVNGAIQKIQEELNEFLEADERFREEEAGDLLFSVINVLRFYNINPELALNITNQKFIKRFQYMEDCILKMGKNLKDSTLEEMEKYWEISKNEDR